MKFSIIIPTFNRAHMIHLAIESVLSQTYNDWELIIVDDGSTDDSSSIIDSLTLDNDIKVIKQQNLGLIKSCNAAINHTNGKYILRLDADDYLHKDAIKELVSKIEEDEEIVLVFPDYWEVDINNTPIREVQRFNFDTEVTLFNLPAHGAVTLFRRDFLIDIGGYDAAHKLTLLTSLAYGSNVDFDLNEIEGIQKITFEDIKFAKQLGYRIKLISESSVIDGKICASTKPKLISIENPLANTGGALNAITIETDQLKNLYLEGEGAGGFPTASSVLSDIYEIFYSSNYKSLGFSQSKLVKFEKYNSSDLCWHM